MLEIVSAKRPLPPTYPSRDEALHSEYVEWETRAKDQLTIVVTDLGDAISYLDFSRIDPSLHDTLKNPTRLAQLLDENNCLLRVPIEDNATIRGIALPATTYSVDPDGKKWVQIFVPGPSNPQTNEFFEEYYQKHPGTIIAGTSANRGGAGTITKKAQLEEYAREERIPPVLLANPDLETAQKSYSIVVLGIPGITIAREKDPENAANILQAWQQIISPYATETAH